MKNCLAMWGLVFLGLLAVAGIVLVATFAEYTRPGGAWVRADDWPVITAMPEAVATLASGSKAIWSNPLDSLPLPDLFSGLTPTSPAVRPESTPTPTRTPLDPVVYRSEVLIRLKGFAVPLEAFVNANERLARDNQLLDDPAWRAEMVAILEGVASAGRALSAAGPPPPEYANIDAWLERIPPEAEDLRANYLLAIEQHRLRDFEAAAENFGHIRSYLYQVLLEAGEAGWEIDQETR